MNRDFKGIWIPREIWLTKELTMQEKLFFVEIDSLDNEDGCFATNGYFAEFFGISKTRVSLVIKKLVSKGMIKSTIIYKQGSKEILKRVLNISYTPSPTKVKGGTQQKLNTPPQQKLKDSNTDINNTDNNTINKEREGEPPPTNKRFIPPTMEQVFDYMVEKKVIDSGPESESFMDHHQTRGWIPKGATKQMSDWKSAVRTWIKFIGKWDKPNGNRYDKNKAVDEAIKGALLCNLN